MALIGKESLVRRKFVNVPKLPNVVQKLGNKKKMLIPVVIVLVLAGGFGVHGLNRHKARKAMAEKMSQVETTTVTKQNLVDSISVTGTVNSADARDVSAIASNVEVETVNYKVGDYVNEGDVVVVLDSSELERKLKEAQNSQALSEYNENKSIETASESYTQGGAFQIRTHRAMYLSTACLVSSARGSPDFLNRYYKAACPPVGKRLYLISAACIIIIPIQ